MADHSEMWQSQREQHINIREPNRDDHDTYHFICFRCEAQNRINEMADGPQKHFYQCEDGRQALEAMVKADMALTKRQKHKQRGSMFKEAID